MRTFGFQLLFLGIHLFATPNRMESFKLFRFIMKMVVFKKYVSSVRVVMFLGYWIFVNSYCENLKELVILNIVISL